MAGLEFPTLNKTSGRIAEPGCSRYATRSLELVKTCTRISAKLEMCSSAGIKKNPKTISSGVRGLQRFLTQFDSPDPYKDKKWVILIHADKDFF
jgi:hypothetical protein